MTMNTWIFLRAFQKHPLFGLSIGSFRHFCETYKKQIRQEVSVSQNWELFEKLFASAFPELHGHILRGDWVERVISEYDEMMQSGVRVCHYLDHHYPKAFDGMEDPPWTFSYFGQPCWNQEIRIGVVGSREVHSATVEIFRSVLSPWIESTPCAVVSGGARGVDLLAHRLALAHHKSTFAWMPSGLKHIYPNQFRQWVEGICVRGAVMSEFGFSQEIRRHHFESRNRLISAFSDVLIIPQATLKSGTMMTAHSALGYGKPLWVFPGHFVQDFMSGNSELLRMGATLVNSVDDLSNMYDGEFKSVADRITTYSDL